MQTQLFSSCTGLRSPSQLGILLAWPGSARGHLSLPFSTAPVTQSPDLPQAPRPSPCSHQMTAPPSSRRWTPWRRGPCLAPFLPGAHLPSCGAARTLQGSCVPDPGPSLHPLWDLAALWPLGLDHLTLSGILRPHRSLFKRLPAHSSPASPAPSSSLPPRSLLIVYSQPPTHSQLPYTNVLP